MHHVLVYSFGKVGPLWKGKSEMHCNLFVESLMPGDFLDKCLFGLFTQSKCGINLKFTKYLKKSSGFLLTCISPSNILSKMLTKVLQKCSRRSSRLKT